MRLSSAEALAQFQALGPVVIAITKLFINASMPISAEKGGCQRTRSTRLGIEAHAVLPSKRSPKKMPRTVRGHVWLVEFVLNPGKRNRPPPATPRSRSPELFA